MYDYTDGKIDWMSYGLKVEGEDGPFVNEVVLQIATIRWDRTVGYARSQLGVDEHTHHHAGHDRGDHSGHDRGDHSGHDHGDHSGHDHGDHSGHDHDEHADHDHGEHADHASRPRRERPLAVVIGPGALAIGSLDEETLAHAPENEMVVEVMDLVPSTIRPSVTVASLMQTGDPHALVTSSDGVFLGETDPDGGEVNEILEAIRERFGTTEPTPEQLHDFLRDRLISEGRSPEEADQFLAEMSGDDEG